MICERRDGEISINRLRVGYLDARPIADDVQGALVSRIESGGQVPQVNAVERLVDT